MKIISVTQPRGRRIAVRAQALDGGATDLLAVVRRLGFLQIDPIAVVARPEHLVLYSRLGHFDLSELDRLIWDERKLFEWNAFIWPIEDLPLARAQMRHTRASASAWTREFLRANARFRRHVLRELDRNGPMLSRQLNPEPRSDSSPHRWWGPDERRRVFDLLQLHGEIAVARRDGNQRLWDLADHVYPRTEIVPWRQAQLMIEETRRRALGVWLERGVLRAYADLPDDPVPARITFLSPFDRLIHDRARAEALFGVHYRLEMYVPKAKRQYGYYVLPILRGESIIGRVDVARDKSSRALRVNGVWWEDGAKPVSLERALSQLEAFVCSAR